MTETTITFMLPSGAKLDTAWDGAEPHVTYSMPGNDLFVVAARLHPDDQPFGRVPQQPRERRVRCQRDGCRLTTARHDAYCHDHSPAVAT